MTRDSAWVLWRTVRMADHRGQAVTRDPRPPEDVRAVMGDGSEVPLDCVYQGYRDGVHKWAAVWVLPELPVNLRIGMLPARTSISLECAAV